jgi:gluconate 2-dehydrogenase gamma chain
MKTGRRQILKGLAALPFAGGFTLSEAQAQTARARVAKGAAGAYTPKFFTAHEWETVRVLSDIVIPRDERSGSATDAKVPEFMDFILSDALAEPRQRESNQVRMRGGLAWLDRECARRFAGRRFLEASETERTSVLDSIAYPKKRDSDKEGTASQDTTPADKTAVVGSPVTARPSGVPAPPDAPEKEEEPLDRWSHGEAFFTAFRDLTASGFWSSEMGVKDLEYTGNTFVAEWKGCPTEVLAKLGLSGADKS